jgi:DNA-binding transcriptional LysR family regulator
MDTRQLEVFCEVVDRASFSQAAEHLGVTQPAVSLAIRSLEKRLGTTLIDRSGRHIEPTGTGRAVYRQAQRMLAVEAEMLRALADEGESVGGTLAIAASSGPGERILPALLGTFRARNPGVGVSLRVDDSETVVERVLDRQVELGIAGMDRPHRSLSFEPFLHDELVLCCGPASDYAGRRLTLDALRAAPLVVQQEGSSVRALVERELRHAGIRPRDLNVVAELGLSESTKAAVEGGLGICFMSRLSIDREISAERLAIATVDGLDLRRVLYAVQVLSRPTSRLVRSFLDFARLELGDQSAASDVPGTRPVRGGRVG